MSISKALIFLATLLLLISLSIIGCTSEKPKVSIPNDSELSPTALEGKKFVLERCTICHNTKRIYAKKEDRAGWERYVGEMIKKGAKVNPEEREKILDYLTSLK